MATYQNSAVYDYDFDMFERHERVSNTSAAPKRRQPAQQPTNRPALKVVEKKKVHPRQTAKQERYTALRSAILFIFAAAFLAMFAMQVNYGARSYELSQQIEAMEKKVSEAKTENVRLTNELNSITTIEKIDSYAVNVLGMSKCESYQIKCIDMSEGDKVLYSGSGIGISDIINKVR